MGKTKKVIAGVTTTALMLGIAGCGGATKDPATEEWDTNQSSSGSYNNNSTSNYDDEDIPPIPDDQNCADWEWDLDDGVWECEDGGSRYFGHYFYGGRYFKSKPDLYKYSEYNNYKNSSNFKGKSNIVHSSEGTSSDSNGSTSKGSSGFGSGSKSYGG
jgi:hypothetical protein